MLAIMSNLPKPIKKKVQQQQRQAVFVFILARKERNDVRVSFEKSSKKF